MPPEMLCYERKLFSEERIVSVARGKAIYLQGVRRSSAIAVQENWPRIMLYDVSECLKLGRKPARFDRRYPLKSRQAPQRELFVRRAQRLDEKGRIDSALDLLYDSVDEMLRNGQFSELDSLLVKISTNELSVDMLLGLLTATLPARSRLPHRSTFYRDVEASIRRRGEFEDGLLTGLE